MFNFCNFSESQFLILSRRPDSAEENQVPGGAEDQTDAEQGGQQVGGGGDPVQGSGRHEDVQQGAGGRSPTPQEHAAIRGDHRCLQTGKEIKGNQFNSQTCIYLIVLYKL